MNASNKHAYTLAELLIVISIILLVGAILFPVLRAAREAGTRTACGSNLRQLHAALRLYIEDNSSVPPPGMYEWVQADPEVKPILICPKDWSKGMELAGGGPRGNPSNPRFVPFSYEPVYLVEWLVFTGRPPNQMEQTDSSKAVFVCLWHRLRPSQRNRFVYFCQAVFWEGHIGEYEYPKFQSPTNGTLTTKEG